MGVIIPEGYGLAAFDLQLSGRPTPFVFTLGYGPSTLGVAEAAWTTVVDGLDDANRLFNAPQFSTSYTWLGVRATHMTGTGPIPFTVAKSVTGTKTEAPLPPNTSFLVRKGTARGGRRGRGRMFLPPAWTGEINVDANGNITSGNVTALNLLLSNLLDDMDTAGIPAVLLHSDGGTPDAITAMIAQPLVATQRRRLR